jgi:Na+/glutamate symporter
MPDFMDKYAAHVVEQARAAGASAEAIQKQVQEMEHFKKLYSNPFLNFVFTFIEPFPVGLLITLISALILRRKPKVAAA